MKNVTHVLIALLLVALTSNSMARPDFDELRAALDGQVELLDQLKHEINSEKTFHLVAGTALARSGRHNEAATHYRRAAEAGSEIAVRSLAQHFTDRNNHVAGYAWSYLAMQLVPDAAELDLQSWRPHWEFQTAAENARKMSDDQADDADRLAEELISELLPVLLADSADKDDADKERCIEIDFEVSKRKPPFYPRDLAAARKTGWSHLYLQIEADGSISEAVPIAGTHQNFDRAAQKAVRRWQLDTTLNGECDSMISVQTVDFRLRHI